MNMKKIQKRIVALLCLTMLMLTSCADKKIPAGAQDFIKQYFPDTSVVLVEIDEEDDEMEYSVWLNDGTKVDFDMQGDWKRVVFSLPILPFFHCRAAAATNMLVPFSYIACFCFSVQTVAIYSSSNSDYNIS